ncbi:radical SAM protein, partial [Candidatus Woesearchaeota archaeon]|nr:radical SAM protein [Candidatus Woesearchaeota archaeon]
ANSLKIHPRNFIVDKDYLVAWIKEVINYLEGIDIAHIDSVGDPTTYPDLIPLIKEIKKLKIKTISMVTNGILLNNIKGLKEAGLDKINISIHTLNKEKGKILFGKDSYDVEKVIENIKELLKNKLEVWLTPVYIQNFNEADIEDLIELSKELKCNIGIQKYEFHKYGRKMKTKEETYYSFYKKINEWENKYNLKLGFKAKDIEVKKTKKLPQKFKLNEKINIEIKAKGWMPNQMIGTARNRAITILDCNKPVNSTVKAKIIQMKNNIYVAK